MPKKPKYRLNVLLIIKERAKKKAEIALAKAIKKLNEEKEKLKELEEEKKRIEKRIEEEKNEMRAKVATGQAKMKDPQVCLNFIRKLTEDLEEQEKKIEEQKEEIKKAEKQLQRCRTDYIIAAQEMNMMEQHKELWHKKMNHVLSMEEQKVLNELGNVIHQMTRK